MSPTTTADVTFQPSISEYFGSMAGRVRDNRGWMIALLATIGGSLAAMTVMSRGTVSALILVPAIPMLFLLGLVPKLIYVATVRLVILDDKTLERRTPWSRSRVESPRLNLVRYRVSFSPSTAGKKFYLGIDNQGQCRFALEAAVWKETELTRLITSFRGEVRGAWTNVIDVDGVSRTFGQCDRW